ncbi:acyl-CoA-binding protein (ACBP)/diazepam binding inhibitor (DBI)/endozepine (EP) [Coemansia sp. BCRC 34490]|nr:acyl-CoA-binding protein (ACBP)/diazepam binding inhibitor (DBI)/endozepine (EP) [Coemansia sp. BCRC 34490]
MAEKLQAVQDRLSELTDEQLTTEFTAESVRVKTLDNEPSNTTKLQLYGLFKQANEGDNKSEQPGIFLPKPRAKWNAWTEYEGLNTRDAQTKYIVLVKSLFGEIVEDDKEEEEEEEQKE